MTKNCIICKEKFKIKKTQGGQNRIICYKCLPTVLSHSERNKATSKLYQEENNILKISIGCNKCGYNKCSTALEWHHKNKNKEGDVYSFVGRNWSLYLKEIKECILLCANCHREIHF